MLDRQVVEEFIDWQFKDLEMGIPENINKPELVETFSLYVEDDYYEWLKDNFKSFFDHGNPDWEWIKSKIQESQVT